MEIVFRLSAAYHLMAELSKTEYIRVDVMKRIQFSIDSYYMKRNTSTITTYNQNRNNINTSRGKSPQRVVKGVKLYNFSEISSYKNINRPYLNELKKEQIKNKLDLEKSTQKRVARRIKKNEMLISYTYNPFTVIPRHSKSQSAMHVMDEPLLGNRNIIQQINTIKQKRFDRQTESKQLDYVQFKGQKFSKLIRSQANHAQSSSMPFRKGLNKSMIVLGEKRKEQEKDPEEIIFPVELDFSDIVSMHDEKWRDKKQRQLNILQLLYDRKFFDRNLTILDKYFFSFNSLVQKVYKLKIKVYRDLSRESRVNASKKPQGRIIKRFELFNQDKLNFNDLINVAAGRYSPQMTFQQLNMDRANDNANNAQIEQDQITYAENTLNRQTTVENQNQSIKEIEEYLKLALNKKQSSYQRLNVFRKQQIKQKMQKVFALLSRSIIDKKLHTQLRSQIGKDMATFTDQNYRYPKQSHERESLIKVKMEQKGKHENIKLEQLLETYRAAKQHDKQLKELINKRI